MWTNGHFRRTFGVGRKQSYHIRCTFVFGVLLLVNSVVAKSRVQSLSCGGRECARRGKSLTSLCTDWLCNDNRGSWLRYLRLHLVLQLALLLSYVFDLLFRLCGLGPDTIDFRFRFRFSAESHALLSVAHTVSAESKTSAFGRPLVYCIQDATKTMPLVLKMGNRFSIKPNQSGQLSLAIPPWVGAISISDGYRQRQGRNGDFCVALDTAGLLAQ